MSKEKIFEEKFNYLLQEISNKFKIDNTNPIYEDDFTKLKKLKSYLNRQMSRYCIDQKNSFIKFSENFSDLDKENLDNTYPIKGSQKEYKITKQNLEECLKPFNDLKNDINYKNNYLELITSVSFENCKNKVKNKIKKSEIGEIIAKEKLGNCYEHFILGKATNKQVIDKIVETVKLTY